MKLKLDLKDATITLNQIKTKDYSSIFTNNPQYKKKNIVMMGLSFRSLDESLIDSVLKNIISIFRIILILTTFFIKYSNKTRYWRKEVKRSQLELEIKNLIISSLDLEDISPQDIDTSSPLFKDGLGLDSIDALELGMALKKKYDLILEEDSSKYKDFFYSVSTLADFISLQKQIELE